MWGLCFVYIAYFTVKWHLVLGKPVMSLRPAWNCSLSGFKQLHVHWFLNSFVIAVFYGRFSSRLALYYHHNIVPAKKFTSQIQFTKTSRRTLECIDFLCSLSDIFQKTSPDFSNLKHPKLVPPAPKTQYHIQQWHTAMSWTRTITQIGKKYELSMKSQWNCEANRLSSDWSNFEICAYVKVEDLNPVASREISSLLSHWTRALSPTGSGAPYSKGAFWTAR